MPPPHATTDALPTATPVPAAPPREAEPEKTVDPELRRKLAQLVMTGFRGLTLEADNPIVAAVRDLGIGGVVLFSYDVALLSPVRNIESPEQVAALNAGLRELAETPLLIAADQEGGWVARLNEAHGFPATLSHQELGERNDPAFTYDSAAQMARTLIAAGINHNFAPVVDVNTNPDNPVIGAIGRSFSDDPAIVTEHAAAFIRARDSRRHDHAQALPRPRQQPRRLAPRLRGRHRNLAAAGTGTLSGPDRRGAGRFDHDGACLQRTLDPDTVATLSKPVITGILREEMGFDGVIFSDDMQMSAIAGNYGFEEAVIGPVAAGVDVLAVGSNLAYDPEIAVKIVDILAAAVMAGQIDEAQIDASNRRIAALKAKSAGGALSDA